MQPGLITIAAVAARPGDRRRNISVIYYELGLVAQDRGRLDEADDWYRKSLAIGEEVGDRPGMTLTYGSSGCSPKRGRNPAKAWPGLPGA